MVSAGENQQDGKEGDASAGIWNLTSWHSVCRKSDSLAAEIRHSGLDIRKAGIEKNPKVLAA